MVTTAALELGRRCSALAWAPRAPDGSSTYLLATASESDVTLWAVDPYGGRMRGDRVAPGNVRRQISALAFSADGQWLFAGDCCRPCRLLAGRCWWRLRSYWVGKGGERDQPIQAVCPVRTGTASGDVVTVNVQRKTVQTLHPVGGGALGALLLAADGRLVVGGADGSITLYSFPVSD